MKTDKIYEKWKKQRADMMPPEDLSDRVMEMIYQQEGNTENQSIQVIEPAIFRVKRFFEAAVAVGLSLFGLYRATYQMIMILTP